MDSETALKVLKSAFQEIGINNNLQRALLDVLLELGDYERAMGKAPSHDYDIASLHYEILEKLQEIARDEGDRDVKKVFEELFGLQVRYDDYGKSFVTRFDVVHRPASKEIEEALRALLPYSYPRAVRFNPHETWATKPRDIYLDYAPGAEVGAPPVKLKSSYATKRLATQLSEQYTKQRLNLKPHLSPGTGRKAFFSERLRRYLTGIEIGGVRVPADEYIGRKYLERGTGLEWEVTGVNRQGALVLRQKLADVSQLKLVPPEGFTVKNFVESFLGYNVAPPVSSAMPAPPAPFVSQDHEAVRVLRNKLLGIIDTENSIDLVYGASHQKGFRLNFMYPVKKFIQEHGWWFEDAIDKRYDIEELAQRLNVDLLEYAEEWIRQNKITKITNPKAMSERFITDWMAAVNKKMPAFKAQIRALLSGIEEDKVARAWGLLRDIAPPDFNIRSAADIIKLKETARRKLPPAEYKALGQILDYTATELTLLQAHAAPGSVLSLDYPIGKEEDSTFAAIIPHEEAGFENVENLLDKPGLTSEAKLQAFINRSTEGRLSSKELGLFYENVLPELRKKYGPETAEALYKYGEYHYVKRRLAEATTTGSKGVEALQKRLAMLESDLAAPWSPIKINSPQALTYLLDESLDDVSRGNAWVPRGVLEQGWQVKTADDVPVTLEQAGAGLVKGRVGDKVVYFGQRSPRLEVYPEDMFTRFYWQGYQGRAPLPFLKHLDASTFSFQNNIQSVNQTLLNISNLKEGQIVSVLDLETTTLPGLEALQQRPGLFGVTEIAARKYRYTGGRLKPITGGIFRRFVKPSPEQESYVVGLESRAAAGETLSQFEQDYLKNIRQVGGLSRLQKRGVQEETAYAALSRFLEDTDVIAGQNIVGFDIPQVLKHRMGQYAGALEKPVIDLMHAAAYLHPRESGNLPYLVSQYGNKQLKTTYARGAHEAMVDVKATGKLLGSFIPQTKKRLAADTSLYAGDYLVHHRGKAGDMPRGVYKVLNYLPDEHTLEFLRTSTNEYYRLKGKSPAELEHLLYSQFMHAGSEYPAEIDALFTADRASRRVRAAMTDLRAAQLFTKRYDALEAYAAKAGVNLPDIQELQTDVLRQLDEEHQKVLLPLQEMPSLLRNQQAAYDWYSQEFKPIHRQFVEQLAEQDTDKAREIYKRYYERLAEKYPYQKLTRRAYPWEERLTLPNVVKGHDVSLQVGHMAMAEGSLRSALNKVGGQTYEERLAFLQSRLAPMLREQGIKIPELSGRYGEQVRAVASALADYHVPQITYEDVLTPRVDEEFNKYAAELQQKAISFLSQTPQPGAARPRADIPPGFAEQAASRAEDAGAAIKEGLAAGAQEGGDQVAWGAVNEFREALGREGIAPLANAERYNMWKSWGLEEAIKTTKGFMKKAGLPLLGLGAAYLGYQMFRNDDLELGQQTPQIVKAADGSWGLSPDLRMIQPPALLSPGVQVKVNATTKRQIDRESIAAQIKDVVQRHSPAALQVQMNIQDNTNKLTLPWWQQAIADAIGTH